MKNLTRGDILWSLLLFTLPMMLGTFLQQTYNLTDTWIVGRFVGSAALAAVGSSYSLMVFVVSILFGLAMGSGTVLSMHYGAGDWVALRRCLFLSFVLIHLLAVLLTIGMFLGLDFILIFMQVPSDVYVLMREYLYIVFWGIPFISLYNYYVAALRAVGDSVIPLYFLVLSVFLNVLLDILFVVVLKWSIAGAAVATVMAQGFSAVGIVWFSYLKRKELRWTLRDCCWDRMCVKDILSFSSLTCIQQSVMNLGILLVQGLVNSFGTVVMAAFAVAVKIDSLAYMPVQEFGNAFSTFIAQNYGAQQYERIRRGVKVAFVLTVVFSLFVSLWVCVFAEEFMQIFLLPSEQAIVQVGMQYLRIEGAFYIGIGILFLLYGYYRAIRKPGMSVVLTILSLGTRVLLSYTFASVPELGVTAIWWSIPIGWFIADFVGVWYYKKCTLFYKGY